MVVCLLCDGLVRIDLFGYAAKCVIWTKWTVRKLKLKNVISVDKFETNKQQKSRV
jgi:hypothetical protein